MPNWCDNKLRVTHSDPAALEKFKDAWNSGELLQTLIPCPAELTNTMCGFKAEGYERELHELQQKLNEKHFGYANWYDWRVNEWGTKWDVGYRDDRENLAVIETDPDGVPFIEVGFDSAWSPPVEAYDKLTDMGYTIQAYYYEPGMAFCGRYDEDGDFTLKIEGNYKWAKKHLPQDINEAFGIVETMMNYEENA